MGIARGHSRSDAVERLTEVLLRLIEDTNTMWRDGELAEDSMVRAVCEDLQAVQYAPHRDPEPWQAKSGMEWLAGTEQAARALHGRGCRWSLHDLVVLPRNGSESSRQWVAGPNTNPRIGRAALRRRPAEQWRACPSGPERRGDRTAEFLGCGGQPS